MGVLEEKVLEFQRTGKGFESILSDVRSMVEKRYFSDDQRQVARIAVWKCASTYTLDGGGTFKTMIKRAIRNETVREKVKNTIVRGSYDREIKGMIADRKAWKDYGVTGVMPDTESRMVSFVPAIHGPRLTIEGALAVHEVLERLPHDQKNLLTKWAEGDLEAVTLPLTTQGKVCRVERFSEKSVAAHKAELHRVGAPGDHLGPLSASPTSGAARTKLHRKTGTTEQTKLPSSDIETTPNP